MVTIRSRLMMVPCAGAPVSPEVSLLPELDLLRTQGDTGILVLARCQMDYLLPKAVTASK